MSGKYDDIIDLSPPTPRKRAAMSMWDRAAQFSSFAALTGYEDVIAETGRLTQDRPELIQDALEELDRALYMLLEDPQQTARITWFQPDARKSGGSILLTEGTLVHYDRYSRMLLFSQGAPIALTAVLKIEFL